MKIEIKNRFNDKIIITGEYDNIKDALLKNSGADLSGADLYGADLSRADGIKLPIFNITGTLHSLLYMNGNIRIGCENHSLTEWVENYKTIGKENGYSEDQICEYGGYITTIATLIKSKEQVYEK